MVDENGRQTITNDGATVMKVQHTILLLRRKDSKLTNDSS